MNNRPSRGQQPHHEFGNDSSSATAPMSPSRPSSTSSSSSSPHYSMPTTLPQRCATVESQPPFKTQQHHPPRRTIYQKCLVVSLAIYLAVSIFLMIHFNLHHQDSNHYYLSSHDVRPYLNPPPSLPQSQQSSSTKNNLPIIHDEVRQTTPTTGQSTRSQTTTDKNQQLRKHPNVHHPGKQPTKNHTTSSTNTFEHYDLSPQMPAPPKPQLSSNKQQSEEPLPPPRLIHILETRFMQNQPNLVQLAKARLELFQSICLPTILGQTVWGDFLWVIRTDPNLEESIKNELIRILQESGALTTAIENPNDEEEEHGETNNDKNEQLPPQEKALTYLLGSNDNYILSSSNNAIPSSPDIQLRPFDIRHMLSTSLSHPELIFAGKADHMQLLLDDLTSHQRMERDIVLWTRLDADDGLIEGYMEYVQRQAIRYFLPEYYDLEMLPQQEHRDTSIINRQQTNTNEEEGGSEEDNPWRQSETSNQQQHNPIPDDGQTNPLLQYTRPKWTYWCNGNNIDWFVTDLLHHPQQKQGAVYPASKTNFCITPGLTLGMLGSQNPSSIPPLHHHEMASYLKRQGGSLCGRDGSLSIWNETHHHHLASSSYHYKPEEKDDGSCFHMIQYFLFPSVRSRTPTSAGMMGVTPSKHQLSIVRYKRNKGKLIPYMWDLLKNQFGIQFGSLEETNRYFGRHLLDVAEENARGQCTLGHSCKTSSKDHLQQFIDQKMELGGGFDVLSGKIKLFDSDEFYKNK